MAELLKEIPGGINTKIHEVSKIMGRFAGLTRDPRISEIIDDPTTRNLTVKHETDFNDNYVEAKIGSGDIDYLVIARPDIAMTRRHGWIGEYFVPKTVASLIKGRVFGDLDAEFHDL